MALERFEVKCSPVGDEGDGAPPQRGVLVEEDVGSANGGELGCCHCVYVDAATEAVGGEKGLGVSAWGKGQRAEVVDVHDDTGVVG